MQVATAISRLPFLPRADALRRPALELGARLWLSARTCKVVLDDWPATEGPSLVVANHTCVLDSAAAICASRALGYDWTVLASPRIVDRYRYVYGDRYLSVGHDAASVAVGMRRAARLLAGTSRRLIWTYPQGDHLLPGARLDFRPGVEALLRRVPNAQVVCAGIYYEMFRRDLPTCCIGFAPVGTHERTASGLELATAAALRNARSLLEANATLIPKRF